MCAYMWKSLPKTQYLNLALALQAHFLKWRLMHFGKELFMWVMGRELCYLRHPSHTSRRIAPISTQGILVTAPKVSDSSFRKWNFLLKLTGNWAGNLQFRYSYRGNKITPPPPPDWSIGFHGNGHPLWVAWKLLMWQFASKDQLRLTTGLQRFFYISNCPLLKLVNWFTSKDMA